MLNRGYGFGERRNRRIYVFLFSIFLLVLLIPTVYAFLWSDTIYVDPQGKNSLTLDMPYGKICWVRIWSIDGISDDSINIWVTNPRGHTILNLGRVTDGQRGIVREFEFHTWQDGVYTVHFDNSFSKSLKTVEYMQYYYTDTLLPAYYVALAMLLILPPLIKHFLGYRWANTIIITLVTTLLVTGILCMFLYKDIIV